MIAQAIWRLLRAPARGAASPPARDLGVELLAQRLCWAWAASAGVIGFGAAWMQSRGLWRQFLDADPSRISLAILLLALVVTLWCGRRAHALRRQAAPGSGWRRAHARSLARSPEQALALLAERSHGPHETGWWFAAACIKLGLLGTVVGFIMMAGTIGRMPSFDIAQVQELLRQMTSGMAVALLTTLAGIVANLWLGLQLLLLDRVADRLAADILAEGMLAGGDDGAAA